MSLVQATFLLSSATLFLVLFCRLFALAVTDVGEEFFFGFESLRETGRAFELALLGHHELENFELEGLVGEQRNALIHGINDLVLIDAENFDEKIILDMKLENGGKLQLELVDPVFVFLFFHL